MTVKFSFIDASYKVIKDPDKFDFHAVEDHPDIRTAI